MNEPTEVKLKAKKEVEYWTYKLNCSEAQLRDAVESVGTSPKRVAEYIHILKGDKQSNLGF